MIRYNLSKLFSALAYSHWESGRKLRATSVDYYRDEILKGVNTLFGMSKGLELDIQTTEPGKAKFTVTHDNVYRTGTTVVTNFECDVEWSDLLQNTGREAAIHIKANVGGGKDVSHTLYFGNTWNPDNDSRVYNRLCNQYDLEKITNWIAYRCYDDADATLYPEAPEPPTLEQS